MAKKKQRQKSGMPKQTPKQKRAAWILIILAVPIVIGLIWAAIPGKKNTVEGPVFYKEGTLTFLGSDQKEEKATIAIEIAENDLELAKGLMWRRSMEPDQGMLFILGRSEPQTFWMLNTYIPLDLIFVDENFRIVNIEENQPPQSLDPINSKGPAKYVVEVVGGFAAEAGIEAGDYISFERE